MTVKEVDIKHEKGTEKGIIYKNDLIFSGSKKLTVTGSLEVDGKKCAVESSKYDERDGVWRVNLAMASKPKKEKSDDEPTQGTHNN